MQHPFPPWIYTDLWRLALVAFHPRRKRNAVTKGWQCLVTRHTWRVRAGKHISFCRMLNRNFQVQCMWELQRDRHEPLGEETCSDFSDLRHVTPTEAPKACLLDRYTWTFLHLCGVLWTLLNSSLQPLFEACWYSCALPAAVPAKRPMKCWTRRQALLSLWIDMAVVKWFWDTESYIRSKSS